MNRVFICGYYNFPRGGAAANYVQSLAKTFIAMGKQVIVITNRNFNISFKDDIYQGIQVDAVQLKTDRIGHYMDFNFFIGEHFKKKLLYYSLDSQDIIIAYSRDSLILNSILSISKKTGAKTGVCLVEWFEKKDYDKWIINIEFWKAQISFYMLNFKFDIIFPISTYIEEYYKRKGCKTFRLPCLVDTTEFEFEKKKINNKKVFIFPGNGKMKDALVEMIQAFSLLEENELSKIEFHICGVSGLAKQIIEDNKLEKYLGNKIIVHNWMTYEKLVDLYKKAHFMLLARDISRMTMANFPSKIPETLSYGIIPICTKVGDYTNLYLKDGINSIIMDGCDPKTILNAIRRALQISATDMMKLSENARKTAENEFDYRVWVDAIKQYLDNGDI